MPETPFAFVQCDAVGCENATGLKICSKCRCYAFCSRECQSAFWKAGHKKVCGDLKLEREKFGRTVAEIRDYGGVPTYHDWASVSSPPHQCCKDCGCDVNLQGEDCAVYRELDGESFFTGMVSTFGSSVPDLRKLHDAGGELEGEQHMMSHDEVMTELAHYDSAGKKLKAQLTWVGLVQLESPSGNPLLPKWPLSKKDMRLYEKCEMSGFVDFSHKPNDFKDSCDDLFDVKFPFPDGLKPSGGRIKIQNEKGSGLPRWATFDIRARDEVRVMIAATYQPGNRFGPPGMGFIERMWVDVISITSFGMITGAPSVPPEAAKSYLSNKNKVNFLTFPITCVIGVRKYTKDKGGYW